MSTRLSMNEAPVRWCAAIGLGALLRLLIGRTMLLPAERARLAAAVARLEDVLTALRAAGRPARRRDS